MIPSYLLPLANHLWQSTLVAGAAGLLAVAFRKNRASVRYWLWLAASVKFLLPFSLLIGLGSRVEWHAAPVTVQPRISSLIVAAGHPFTPADPAPLWASVPTAPSQIPTLLLAVWLLGFAVAAFAWLREWLRVRAAARTATPLPLAGAEIQLMDSPALLEPCVFGVFRPVLLLPSGIRGRLTPDQLGAILLHERCHIRRRDNLSAAVHMVVETLFWFYPAVYWIRKRLMDEREAACDEEVLGMTGSPQVYAEGILAVCKFGLQPAPVFAAGVTGSDLKKRIEEIMGDRAALRLGSGRKLLLVLAAIVALAGPVVIGVIDPKSGRAQVGSASRPAFEVVSIKRSAMTFGSWFRYLPGGRLTAMTWVEQLIQVAYGVEEYQVSGGPSWLTSDRYDIEAKAANLDASEAEKRMMMQSLLDDRFQLKVRRETKEFAVYALVVDKGGLKIKPLQQGEADTCRVGNSFACGIRTMAQLAQGIRHFAGRPVIDRTGLDSEFDLKLDFDVYEGSNRTPPPDFNKPSLSEALREQLGLKLEAQKISLPVLVIESIQRPREN